MCMASERCASVATMRVRVHYSEWRVFGVAGDGVIFFKLLQDRLVHLGDGWDLYTRVGNLSLKHQLGNDCQRETHLQGGRHKDLSLLREGNHTVLAIAVPSSVPSPLYTREDTTSLISPLGVS